MDSVGDKTVKGNDGVVVVIGFAEGDGGCGV